MEITKQTTTPWLALSCADSAVATGIRTVIAPADWRGTAGITAGASAKLRQEKTALIQARLGEAAFGHRSTTIDMVFGYADALGRRPVVDPQTTSTANGVVQGPPPWRHPVIT
ncbi:hypothetical protein [Sphaerisporangium aureirubrum]|uniref:Uncharacterized protein n=1 Tax=Sphaerisporangium aureirubrum TaxID=1544736 RepID=A0ABW1NHF0_9ACTN